MSKEEVKAWLGDQECDVKTLDSTHLYCDPPEVQPLSVDDSNELPSLKVIFGSGALWFLSCWLLQGFISKAGMLFRDFPARLVCKGQWFTHSHT